MAPCTEQELVAAKQAARARILAKRDAMPLELRRAKSERICAEAFAVLQQKLPMAQRADTVERACEATDAASTPLIALFASMKSEVDLWNLLERVYDAGWRACFPCVPRPGQMDFFEVPKACMQAFLASRQTSDLPEFLAKPLKRFTPDELAALGFALVDPAEVDVLVSPLVGFDSAGRRLGYGGGNYDRYLEQLRDDALVFGIAFSEQELDRIPCEPHDLPLPLIVHA